MANSSSRGQEDHVAQMQFHQLLTLKIEDVLSYLDKIKCTFYLQPHVYNNFLDIMKEFRCHRLDIPRVVQRIAHLFRGHPEFIVGFNNFLPLHFRIEVPPNEQVQVNIPGTNLGPVGTNTGPLSLTTVASWPPTTTPIYPNPDSRSNQQSHTTLPHSSGYEAHVAQIQRLQFQMPKDALAYLNHIKYRCRNQPEMYNTFLDIMKAAKSQRLDILGIIQRVAYLFQEYPELIVGFNNFLPLHYRIQVQPNRQVQFNKPATNLGPGGTSAGPKS